MIVHLALAITKPDVFFREHRLVSEVEELSGCKHNASGAYDAVCVELETDALAVCALLQAHHILQLEGTSAATAFGHTNIQVVMANTGECLVKRGPYSWELAL